MRNLTVEAASLNSARAIESALRGVERELVADDGRYCIHVTLPAGDQGIVAVLNALEVYVRERGTSARISLDGQSYTMGTPAADA